MKAAIYNDGFKYESHRENFQLKNNAALRLTLQHPDNGKAGIAMWWKVEEGVKSDADFLRFRQKVLNAPTSVDEKNGVLDLSVSTPAGKLGLKTDLKNKKRLEYYNPTPLPEGYLFNVDRVEIGKPILEKYKLKIIQ